MSIKAGEIGRPFYYITNFDLSNFSALTLKFTHEDGTTTFTVTNPAVTAPAAVVTLPDVGDIAASTYMYYETTGLDFTKPGTWTVCGTYEDASPKKYFGNHGTFVVGSSC